MRAPRFCSSDERLLSGALQPVAGDAAYGEDAPDRSFTPARGPPLFVPEPRARLRIIALGLPVRPLGPVSVTSRPVVNHGPVVRLMGVFMNNLANQFQFGKTVALAADQLSGSAAIPLNGRYREGFACRPSERSIRVL